MCQGLLNSYSIQNCGNLIPVLIYETFNLQRYIRKTDTEMCRLTVEGNYRILPFGNTIYEI